MKILRWLVLSSMALLSACSREVPTLGRPMERLEPWDRALVEAMAALPVQYNGRVKPFATVASFVLYFVHGRRDVQFVPNGGGAKVTLEPTEWLLDVWCFPEQAAEYPLFRIENTGVLDALGIENEGQAQRFEYLSFNTLAKHGSELVELVRAYQRIEPRDRNPVQEHLVGLHQQLMAYFALHQQMLPLQGEFAVEGTETRAALGGRERVRLGAIVANADPFVALLRAAAASPDAERYGNVARISEAIASILEERHGGPALFPPAVPFATTEQWLSLPQVVEDTLTGKREPRHVEMLAQLQEGIAASDMGQRTAALRAFRDSVVQAAQARGEYGTVATEAYYYRANWHYRALHWFLFGFVLAAVGWLLPRNRPIWWASMAVTALALGMLVTDVWLRCVIRDRPPITNLYDTFLFIAGVGVLVSWVAEWILPRRIALAAGPFLGALLIMFARMFEVADGKDTMDPLVAVLDSNFWLATHVTTINIGYSAGLFAALFGNIWLLLRATRLAHPSDTSMKALVRMTYGITCFGLAFAVVGTILGGVWANDSWGRFWGWDPKENGALMICLSQIALLHARMTGMVRDFGFAVWSTVTGMVVLFSWFHVNLLGVGLHNYGFSSGLRDGVWRGYAVETAVLLVAVVDRVLRPEPALPQRAGSAPGPMTAPQ